MPGVAHDVLHGDGVDRDGVGMVVTRVDVKTWFIMTNQKVNVSTATNIFEIQRWDDSANTIESPFPHHFILVSSPQGI